MKTDERMKAYEVAQRSVLPENSHCILRLDGKKFSAYTKHDFFDKPFDIDLHEAIIYAAQHLANEIQGVKKVTTHSDEVSIYFTDTDSEQTQLWLGGNVQKITSLAAAYMSVFFANVAISSDFVCVFDARVFTVPSRDEALEYFRSRNESCVRNAWSMVGQQYFSHAKMQGKSSQDILDMLNDETDFKVASLPDSFWNGTEIFKEPYEEEVTFTHKGTGEIQTILTTRSRWVSESYKRWKK